MGLSVSPKTALFVLIFFLVQQQVENHLLVPKVMERQVGVSAVTVIIALLIGGSVLGITGAILAVPSAAILQVLVQELLTSATGCEDARPHSFEVARRGRRNGTMQSPPFAVVGWTFYKPWTVARCLAISRC